MGQSNGHKESWTNTPDGEKQQKYGDGIEANSEETHFGQTLSWMLIE